MAVHLAVAGDVFDGVLICAILFLTRTRTELSQLLRIILSSLQSLWNEKDLYIIWESILLLWERTGPVDNTQNIK